MGNAHCTTEFEPAPIAHSGKRSVGPLARRLRWRRSVPIANAITAASSENSSMRHDRPTNAGCTFDNELAGKQVWALRCMVPLVAEGTTQWRQDRRWIVQWRPFRTVLVCSARVTLVRHLRVLPLQLARQICHPPSDEALSHARHAREQRSRMAGKRKTTLTCYNRRNERTCLQDAGPHTRQCGTHFAL